MLRTFCKRPPDRDKYEKIPPKDKTRRLWGLLGSLALAACGFDEGGIKHVPRNRTLILGLPQMRDYDSFNPFIVGTQSPGFDYLFEPLYFYNAYVEKDHVIPWIAKSHEYNADYTEVTIHIRKGVTWSDGRPWTAHDLKFTVDMLKAHAPELAFSTDMDTWVAEVQVPDSLTARFVLKAPNPRFVFSYFTYNFGNGIHIVPKHIWEGEDPTSFKNLDLARRLPVVSGPYRLALSEPQQRLWDLREDWWAAQIGFPAPAKGRAHHLPAPKATRTSGFNSSSPIRWISASTCGPPTSRPSSTKIPTSPRGRAANCPIGYRDWWPPALGFNNLEPPFDDPDMRWAVNHAIDREQLVAIGWQGAGEYTLLPFPHFPPLMHYINQVQDLLAKYPVGKHDLAQTAAIMERKGWSRDAEGMWQQNGERLRIPVVVFPSLFPRLHARAGRTTAPRGFRRLLPHVLRRLYPHDSGHGPRLCHGQRRLRARSVFHPPALPQPLRPAHRHGHSVFLALAQRGF